MVDLEDWILQDVRSQIEQYGDQTIMQFSRECQEVFDGVLEIYSTLVDSEERELSSDRLESFLNTPASKKVKLQEWNIGSSPLSERERMGAKSTARPLNNSSEQHSGGDFSFSTDHTANFSIKDSTRSVLESEADTPQSVPSTPVTPVNRIIPSLLNSSANMRLNSGDALKGERGKNLLEISASIARKQSKFNKASLNPLVGATKPQQIPVSKAPLGLGPSGNANVAQRLAALKKLTVAERQRLVRERKREEDERRREQLQQKLQEKSKRVEKVKPVVAKSNNRLLQPQHKPSNSFLDSLYPKRADEEAKFYAKPFPKVPVPQSPSNVVSILNENGELPDITSESDSDFTPVKKLSATTGKPQLKANWTLTPKLLDKLHKQEHVDPDTIFGPMQPVKVDAIFGQDENTLGESILSKVSGGVGKRSGPKHHRSSSGGWAESGDMLTVEELISYKKAMKYI